ncbi:MAG: EAL domain-containing protein, partial [Proteobacteria bacterium]|nr:EAL domain-containing protein [Pseudomonadota bacterium]
GLMAACPWCVNDRVFAGETVRMETQDQKNGRWYYMVNTPIYNPDGTMAKQTMVQDITERKLAEEEVVNSEAKYRTLIETTSEGYVMLDCAGLITAVNPSFCAMLGMEEQNLLGEPILEFMDPENQEVVRNQMAKWTSTSHRNYEFCFQRSDGTEVNVIASSTTLYGPTGELEGAFALFIDITERKRMETQLRFQAMHDPLTNLANRTLCHDRIGQALERARRRSEYYYAVLFVDLDRFKVINDTLGHAVGDQLLREVSLRIAECTRELDTVARFGGDEFIVLLEEMHSPRKAIQVVKRMRENLRKPITLAGNEVQVTGSIGIVLGPGDYQSADEVVRYANIAMHRAKGKGRDRFKVFSTKLLDHAVQLMTMETDMDNAMAVGEFYMNYQPIVRIKGGERLYGFEALVRWHHPDRGQVPPADFIPIAEETGLITDLGLWVLFESARTMASWREKYPQAKDLFLSVNVSARQFSQQDLAGKIKRILELAKMPPDRIKLEITETAIMENAAQAVVVLKRLKEMGITLSIDDFGTGYSSMSYLQKLPLDNLKIDLSFVQMLDVAPENIEIVKAIINLAHTLELEVVAEGVEKIEHQNILLALGCEYCQGYLYSHPLPKEEAEEFVARIPLLT